MQTNVIPIGGSGKPAEMFGATVKSVTGKAVVLLTDRGVVTAGVAVSCLVAPLAEDRVLASTVGGECYVLAVLERGETGVTLEFAGDVSVKADHGRVGIVSGEDIDLVARGHMRVCAPETHVLGEQVQVTAQTLRARTTLSECHTREARLFSDALDVVSKRVTQRAETVMRWVEGVQTLNVGSLVQRVRRTFTSHAERAVMTAEKDMMIDGERIHMG